MKGTVQASGIAVVLFAILALAGCVTSPAEQSSEGDEPGVPLTNTYWQLVRVAGEAVPATGSEQKAHILFLDDGRVSGFSGCNQYMGNYQVRGENLLFDSMGSTRMACEENLVEELLFAALAKTVGVNLDRTELLLLGEAGEELAVFEAARLK